MNLIALVSNANCTQIVVVAAVNELFPFASKSHLCLGRGKGTCLGKGCMCQLPNAKVEQI